MKTTLKKMYNALLLTEERGVVPHLVGPPGSGKSTIIQELADELGVKCHIINVSRISPLELEGIQIHTKGKLEMFLATMWANIQEGDIVFLDEFLRGFPEVYNGMLDILTSRQVAGHSLPKAVFFAASNTVAAYDPALSDRLLHLWMQSPSGDTLPALIEREKIAERLGLAEGFIRGQDETLISERDEFINEVVAPMYEQIKTGMAASGEALSVRNLIGQRNAGFITSNDWANLLLHSNDEAVAGKEWDKVWIFQTPNTTPAMALSVQARKEYLAWVEDNKDSLTPEQDQHHKRNLLWLAKE